MREALWTDEFKEIYQNAGNFAENGINGHHLIHCPSQHQNDTNLEASSLTEEQWDCTEDHISSSCLNADGVGKSPW